jgi:hypothetical protein
LIIKRNINNIQLCFSRQVWSFSNYNVVKDIGNNDVTVKLIEIKYTKEARILNNLYIMNAWS